MLCCTPMLSVNVCWVPQDQLCFSVTHWPCASKGCRVALGIYLSQHNVQLGILSQNKTGLFFQLGSDPEEVTPTISEPLGGCVSYMTCPKSTTRPAQQGWPMLSLKQFFPFELCLMLLQPKLNLSLLNTSLANLFSGTISFPSQGKHHFIPSLQRQLLLASFFPPGLTTVSGTSDNVSLPCKRREALCQQPTSGREIYICEKHMYRAAITQIINIYTADNSHHGQDEYCHNSSSCWGGECKI